MRILCIDANPAICRYLVRQLTNLFWDVRIACAANGNTALAAAAALKPDVVLTEVCLPDMDGTELAEHLLTQYPKITVLFQTTIETVQKCSLSGHYILKPYGDKELKEFMEEALTKENTG